MFQISTAVRERVSQTDTSLEISMSAKEYRREKSVVQGEGIAYKSGDFSSGERGYRRQTEKTEISTLVQSIADKERERILEWSLC